MGQDRSSTKEKEKILKAYQYEKKSTNTKEDNKKGKVGQKNYQTDRKQLKW